MSTDSQISSNVFGWTHDYLIHVLTTGKNRIVKNPRLINALKFILREDFVLPEVRSLAYNDSELDIGFAQNISKPTITVYLIELLNPKAGGRVLDIGTGSGYSAALLAKTVGDLGKVFTVEREQYLIDTAKKNLMKYSDLKNVEFFFRDGSLGLPERAPFDAIHIGAAIETVHDNLKQQLNIGGTLVAPLKSLKILKIKRLDATNWEETEHEGFLLDEIRTGIN